MDKKFLILVPAYNADSTIAELIKEVLRFVDKDDIVVVDDGSTDQTFEVAKRFDVVVLRHQKNEGKGEALKTGFRYALQKGYPALITMDADLQHDPRSIIEFVRNSENSSGIIVGTREINLKIMPFARWLTNNLTSAIVSILSGGSIRDSQSGYRLISTEVLKSIKLRSKKYDLESEILVKAKRKGFKIDRIPIKTIYEGEKSFINPLIDTGRFIRLMWKSLWW